MTNTNVRPKRTVFFVSESTGITADALGKSLLSQFSQEVDFRIVYMPYIDSPEKARTLAGEFDRLVEEEGDRPIVFATMAEQDVRHVLEKGNCLYIELFDTFIGAISKELDVLPSGRIGLAHGMANGETYEDRMSIINFAMVNDDGARLDKYDQADLILSGVSRSGKTPTCLYLALQFGVKAANYPLTEEDFDDEKLPQVLLDNREKVIGLTIDPIRLSRIREERRPGSRYASQVNCQKQVRMAQQLFKSARVPMIDTTSHSIEEISSRIMKRLRPI